MSVGWRRWWWQPGQSGDIMVVVTDDTMADTDPDTIDTDRDIRERGELDTDTARNIIKWAEMRTIVMMDTLHTLVKANKIL